MPGVKSVTLPDTLYYIYTSAFEGMTSLSSITIPQYCRSIASMAFQDCISLKEISFDTKLIKNINVQTFKNCLSLEKVTLPDGLVTIDSKAFQNCTSLKEITIPNSVNSISSTAFSGCGEFTIKGYRGSYAEQYAKDNGIDFYILDPLYGDANEDGEVNILDVTCIQKYKIGTRELTYYGQRCADVNKDGNVTVRDATLIQMKLAKIITDY